MVIGWLTRVVVVLALLAVVAFDAVSLLVTRVGASDAAQAAAFAGATELGVTRDPVAAEAAARRVAAEESIEPQDVSVWVATDGTVTVRTRRIATSLVLKSVPRISDWTVSEGVATSSGSRL